MIALYKNLSIDKQLVKVNIHRYFCCNHGSSGGFLFVWKDGKEIG